MNVKEINAGGCSGGGILYPSTSSFGQPSSKWENEECPKPFLMKLSTMVNDPNTNSIISWSRLGDSIIVWDHIKFSQELLPEYFRHNNFSSFIYQLNNYGFRKIGSCNWEYENPLFQAGKEHLLARIKRRISMSESGQGRKRTTNFIDININCTEQELETMRNEINESKLEIDKLKKEQAEMESHVLAYESYMKNAENNSKIILTMFLAKVCNESFAQKMRKETEKETRDDEIEKMKPSNENGSEVDYLDEKLSENNSISISSDELVQQSQEINATNSKQIEKRNSDDYNYWEKMMRDEYQVCEIETEIYDKKKSRAEIAAELELLPIGKPPN
ncbi:hypothetical protein RD792_009576 [Penstemon davidsonii]|uniref:HSF-type DNA-binding domain-containing protein n=1 Tax=Penstemon davidsonii TaxID=160366 RepID=A0ABR0D0R7_9LAMI|nr:hypothetical protein RD792_009576 [Penstemon davidsonii]